MMRLIPERITLIKISLGLNILFICGVIFFVLIYYPKLIVKFDYYKQKVLAVLDENHKNTDKNAVVFYDAAAFEIIGRLPNVNTYSRLPENAKKMVQQPVWKLSKNTAGIAVRFSSNTTKVIIRWTLHNNANPYNQTSIASKGLDLYSYEEGKWKFVGIAKPTESIENKATVIEGMENKYREYLLNLPLYDGIHSLTIGIDKGATIEKPKVKLIDTSNPIVFYGTSITQGASASRPGLTYTAQIERDFNKEVINLGFSGNGKFEKEIGKFIMTANPSVIVLDCTPNSPADTIKKNLPQLLDYILSVNDTISILLVERVMSDFAYFKKDNKTISESISFINEQNKALREVYEGYVKANKNIAYIRNQQLIDPAYEATIDGIHFNDIGHQQAYECLRQEIKKHLSH